MSDRRWIILILVMVCLASFGAALADETISLDEIGIRYTPVEGETCVTREQMDTRTLEALNTDAQTLLAAMDRDGVYLISLSPDGRQVSLEISDKPALLNGKNYCDLTFADKDQFLKLLARSGNYGTAFWKNAGYALFSSTAEAQGQGTLSYVDMALSTLYLNNIYTLRMDLIGRDVSPDDSALLLDMAARMLRLGAKAQTSGEDTEAAEESLTLPFVSVASDSAVLTYQSHDCDLTLDPVAATIGMTHFTLSGSTVPGGSLRYSVNGKSSSRFRADADGSFSVTVPNLNENAENAVEVVAYEGDLKTVVNFTVTVNWQIAPVALQIPDAVEGDSITLNGLVLPGSTVQLTKGRGSSRISVGEDGAFTVQLSLRALGENDFSLRIQCAGYHRNDYAFTVTRRESETDLSARLQDEAQTVDYQQLTANPSAYEGDILSLNGTAGGLSYGGGSPMFVLTIENGDRYAVHCSDLLAIRDGDTLHVFGALTGATEDGLPGLTLEALSL